MSVCGVMCDVCVCVCVWVGVCVCGGCGMAFLLTLAGAPAASIEASLDWMSLRSELTSVASRIRSNRSEKKEMLSHELWCVCVCARACVCVCVCVCVCMCVCVCLRV